MQLTEYGYEPATSDGATLRIPWPAEISTSLPKVGIPRLSLLAAGDMTWRPGRSSPQRIAWLRAEGLDPDQYVGISLLHSHIVHWVEGAGASLEGDGLLSLPSALTLGVTVADCMPIFLHDPDSGAYGVLHSGWKGTGILDVAVRQLAERAGSRPERLLVAFGPHIGACCYEVDAERARQFGSQFGPASVIERDGRWHLDLLAANLELARRLGVGQVSYTRLCTCCDRRFGSYRRQGQAAFNRMLALIPGQP